MPPPPLHQMHQRQQLWCLRQAQCPPQVVATPPHPRHGQQQVVQTHGIEAEGVVEDCSNVQSDASVCVEGIVISVGFGKSEWAVWGCLGVVVAAWAVWASEGEVAFAACAACGMFRQMRQSRYQMSVLLGHQGHQCQGCRHQWVGNQCQGCQSCQEYQRRDPVQMQGQMQGRQAQSSRRVK